MAEQNVGAFICEKLGFTERINTHEPVLGLVEFQGQSESDCEGTVGKQSELNT